MFLLYFIVWMIFFGSVTLESVLFGIGIAAVIFAFTCKFMDYSIQKERNLYRNIPRILRFIGALIQEVIQANITVIHMILSEKEELRPVLVHFRMDLKSPMARSFMADSITLTPGTITVSLEEDEYVVHCLDEELAEGIDVSPCARWLEEFEKS